MTTITRTELRKSYLSIFDSFASHVTDDGISEKAGQVLESAGLITRQDVNGEYEVWQCFETYDSISRRTAERRFDAKFPKGQDTIEIVEPAKGHGKGGGRRYTEDQLTQGAELRSQGLSWSEVAFQVAGTKASYHFSKAVRESAGQDPLKGGSARKSSGRTVKLTEDQLELAKEIINNRANDLIAHGFEVTPEIESLQKALAI